MNLTRFHREQETTSMKLKSSKDEGILPHSQILDYMNAPSWGRLEALPRRHKSENTKSNGLRNNEPKTMTGEKVNWMRKYQELQLI